MKLQISFLSTFFLALVVLQSVATVHGRRKGNKPGGGSNNPLNQKPSFLDANTNYMVGLGIADVTGPSVQGEDYRVFSVLLLKTLI